MVRTISWVFAALVAAAGSSWAQGPSGVVRLEPEHIKWKDNPNLPKGAQSAILQGDPSKPDLIVLRLKLPPNYRLPPHTHPFAENLTVLSGSVGLGAGEKFDAKGPLAKAGSFYAQPAKQAHYMWTRDEEAVIEFRFVGPGGISYIDPADDPRAK